MTKLSATPDPEPDETPVDPFSPEANRVSGPTATVRDAVFAVRLGKPSPHEYFRINADPDFMHDYQLLQFNDGKDKELYFVYPALREHPLIADDLQTYRLFVGMNNHTKPALFLWPVRIYDEDAGHGGGTSWSESSLEIAEKAKNIWVRLGKGNKSAGRYTDAKEAEGFWGEPKWPANKTFGDFVRTAFQGRVVDSPEHSLFDKLRGEK